MLVSQQHCDSSKKYFPCNLSIVLNKKNSIFWECERLQATYYFDTLGEDKEFESFQFACSIGGNCSDLNS